MTDEKLALKKQFQHFTLQSPIFMHAGTWVFQNHVAYLAYF